jgi:hypothetical protein
VVALVVTECWEALFGTQAGEEIHAVDPLLNGVIPTIEAEIPRKNLDGEAV